MTEAKQTDFETAVTESLEIARETYEPRRVWPIGWVKIQGLDGRTKEVRELKDDDRFSVSSSNGSRLGPSGTTVSIREFSCQAMDPKAEATREFLAEMQDRGFLTDGRLYTRMD